MKNTAETETVIIEKGPGNRRLQKLVVAEAPHAKDRVALDIQKYIIDALSSTAPTVIPFALRNQTLIPLAKYLKYDRSGSSGSLAMYFYCVWRYSRWIGLEPDDLIAECKDVDGTPNAKKVSQASIRLDNYYEELRAEGLAPKTVGVRVAVVKTLYRVNGLIINSCRKLGGRERARDRAPTPEELKQIIDLAGLRGKVIVSMLALGGFREGTLSQLQYRHVRKDLEDGTTPLHVRVESEITKGKYHDYDTFVGKEAVDYLRAYIEVRKRGTEKLPPETLTDESPLIRSMRDREPRGVGQPQIYACVHELFRKAGLIKVKRHRRYELRPHSIRKYFRTQLAALGVDRDLIEYMMGHTISTYYDIEMKGIQFLRNVYAASGLSITPKTRLSKIESLKQIMRAWGMNPEEILTKEALTQPYRTYVETVQQEDDQVKALSRALKEMMRKELLDAR